MTTSLSVHPTLLHYNANLLQNIKIYVSCNTKITKFILDFPWTTRHPFFPNIYSHLLTPTPSWHLNLEKYSPRQKISWQRPIRKRTLSWEQYRRIVPSGRDLLFILILVDPAKYPGRCWWTRASRRYQVDILWPDSMSSGSLRPMKRLAHFSPQQPV